MSELIDTSCDSLIEGQDLYRPGDHVMLNGTEYVVQRTITVRTMRELNVYHPNEAAFRRYLKDANSFN